MGNGCHASGNGSMSRRLLARLALNYTLAVFLPWAALVLWACALPREARAVS